MRPSLIVTSALLLSLTACGGSGNRTETSLDALPSPAMGIPFPDDRGASALTEYVLNGAAADLSSAGAVPSGTAMVLSAEIGGYEYALYRFNPTGASAGAPDSVSVLLEDGVTTEAWIGRADYDAGMWQFEGPFTKPKTLLLDDAKYISPDGNVWVAVMVAAQQSATVNALSVRTINPANQPPTAALDADVTSGNAPLTVQFDASGSTDSDGTIIEYAWDFEGAGGYSFFTDGPAATHAYTTAGLRTMRVRVTDDQFARATATIEIDVNVVGNQPPVAHFSRTPVAGNAPLSVDFDAVLSADPDGSIVRYDWDFDGDGTWDAYDSGPQVSFTYTQPGAFMPKLRVTDNLGAQATDQRSLNVNVEGNDSPVADLSASPDSGDAPLTVTLDASGSSDPDGSIVSYEWDFDGDGLWDGYGDSASATYTYTAVGLFDAKVRVTDDNGAQDIASAEVSVNAPGNDPPVADISASPTSGNAPLLVDFDAAGSSDTDGSIVRYDWDFDGDGSWDSYDGPEQISHTYTDAGSYTAKLRVTDDVGAQDADTVVIEVNAPPVAHLHSDNPKVNNGETVFLDASASSDADGNIADYEWDLDGDGVFNETGEEADAQGSSTAGVLMGNTPGELLAQVRVTDDAGAQDTAELTLTVLGWLTLAVDTAGDVGRFTSLAVVNGKPGISYQDNTNDDLKFAYSSTSDGSSGWTAIAVDTAGDVGGYSSLVLVNGKPAISYYDDTNGDLKYAYSTAADGSSGWTALTVDAAAFVGAYSSLVVVNGKPAIGYFDNFDTSVKYAYSSTTDGSSGWATLTVDSVGTLGYYTSLAVVNGKPAISYYDLTNADLKYAYSSLEDGSSGWTAIAVDTAGSVGQHTALAVVNGKPAISYFDNSNNDLKYAYSSTANGSSGWTALAVDTGGIVGRHTSLALVNSKPAISYYDNSNNDLKFAYSSMADGSSGWTAITVDAPDNLGTDTSLAEVDGKSAISYRDLTNEDLKYAVLYE